MSVSKNKSVDIVTMGCSKNLVDSERLLKIFGDRGFVARHNPDNICADEVIINTCGFIGDAKEESIDMILRCCDGKKDGRIGKISVMGCLSQRYGKDLAAEIPEVDRWYGKFDWKAIAEDLGVENAVSRPGDRTVTTGAHHAYIKIAEGCNRFCAFCAIPLITGRYASRPMDDIIEETRTLAAQGYTEFNVIAQDLSYYGVDLYGKSALAELVDGMAGVEGVRRIRLHYAYPTDFPYDVLPVMARHANVCNYLDIALQHVSDNVLKNMRRHITGDETRKLLQRIRAEVPGIHIRTTLMVGFPGEGEKEFNELLEFVKAERFERMGAFAYCEEEDTFAAKNFEDSVPAEVKQSRLDLLMETQQRIALEHNEAKIGTTLEVVIDGVNDEYYVGRSEYDSPEVDPEVLIDRKSCSEKLETGQYYKVRIIRALPYDLIGEVVGKA